MVAEGGLSETLTFLLHDGKSELSLFFLRHFPSPFPFPLIGGNSFRRGFISGIRSSPGAGTSFTLMETAKANNLRLEDYIEHLLTVLPERLALYPDASIDDLLPWADGMQKMFAMR